MTIKKILLVEGKDDKHVMMHLAGTEVGRVLMKLSLTKAIRSSWTRYMSV